MPRAARASATARLRELLHVGAVGPLGWMTTWPGNSIWFSEDGGHAVAYREGNGVAITIGHPVGTVAGTVAAAREFVLHCDDRGLIPVFYGVRPALASSLGGGRPWLSVPIGEDTVLHPAGFSLVGKRWADVRSSMNRADRSGIRALWTDWTSCSLLQRAQVSAISEEWLADRQLPELGFTLGGIEELKDPEVRLMGYTLDFMRRRPDGVNGVMEFLIATTAQRAREQGLEFLSLSAAPLTTAQEAEPGALERALGTVARVLEPAYGFRSLALFKDKFQPTREPLVLAYPEAGVLPVVGVALARAYLPRLSVREVVRMAGTLR